MLTLILTLTQKKLRDIISRIFVPFALFQNEDFGKISCERRLAICSSFVWARVRIYIHKQSENVEQQPLITNSVAQDNAQTGKKVFVVSITPTQGSRSGLTRTGISLRSAVECIYELWHEVLESGFVP